MNVILDNKENNFVSAQPESELDYSGGKKSSHVTLGANYHP